MTSIKITNLELSTLTAILDSEYNDDGRTDDAVDRDVWQFSVGEGHSFAGVCSSLVKKGLADVGDHEGNGNSDDFTISITQAGFEAWSANFKED